MPRLRAPNPIHLPAFRNPLHLFCMETQGYPDAVHHGNFPSVLVDKGEEYRQTTVYRFRSI